MIIDYRGYGLPMLSATVLSFCTHADVLADPSPVSASAENRILSINGGMTTVSQSMSEGEGGKSSFSYSTDLVLTGDFNHKGSLTLYINYAQGRSVETGAVTGLNGDDETGSPIDGGYSDMRIAEAFYTFAPNKQTRFSIGKIDPTGLFDSNGLANDETSQFLSDAFINNPSISFPGYTNGVHLGIGLTDTLEIHGGAFENGSDVEGELSSSFSALEAILSIPAIPGDNNVRFMVWQCDNCADDEDNGYALSLDQSINGYTALFARYGGKNSDTNGFDSAASLGGRLSLGVWTMAGAYSMLSAVNANAEDEKQFEIYMQYALYNHAALSLHFQSVNGTGFGTGNDNTIVSTRMHINF